MDESIKTKVEHSVVKVLIDKIKNEDDGAEIRTKILDGYEKPDKVVIKSGQKGYIPDVVSITEDRQDLYEVELDENDYKLDKWKLFSLYTKKTHGSFNIIIPKNRLDLIKDVLDLNKINANILYFN